VRARWFLRVYAGWPEALAKRTRWSKGLGAGWGSFLHFLTLRAMHGCNDIDILGTRHGGYRAHPGMADKVKKHAFDHCITWAIEEVGKVLSAPEVIFLVIRLLVLSAVRNTSSMAYLASQGRERSMKMDDGGIITTIILVLVAIVAYWVINSNDN